MKKIYYDIETEGQPADQLTKLVPEFEAPGNLKDPVKIAAAIEEKRADWFNKTALKAITGKIISFTYAVGDEAPKFITGDEAMLIRYMVNTFLEVSAQRAKAYGWNSATFDMPFFLQRAAALDIPAFIHFVAPSRGRYYLEQGFVDARAVWAVNSMDMTGTSLGTVARALGVGEKEGDGKDFAALLKSDPVAAEKYAKSDVTLLRGICQRMGI